MLSGGSNQSVLSATVSGDLSHRGEEEGEVRSVSVVVENELGNSSEIIVVLQSEAEWVGCFTVNVQCTLASLHIVTITCTVRYTSTHLRSTCIRD